MVLLSAQNTFKLIGKMINAILRLKNFRIFTSIFQVNSKWDELYEAAGGAYGRSPGPAPCPSRTSLKASTGQCPRVDASS